ncbi:MAG: class I SAM-dependent methyltransferase [Bacteroidetes bacterium CG_4_9_14_3_um_filter_41_19]|nr:MAG: class I SAM-dependent methyltransferase [Bacteroidetes bacterium CG_4_9_14_3_um_filter_41_19]
MKIDIIDKQINNTDIIYLSRPSAVSMDTEWYDVTNKDHFWMRWRFGLISNYLGSLPKDKLSILEIGCGNGINMELFESKLGLTIDGCDLSELALKKIKNVAGRKYLYNIFDFNHQLLEKYDVILLLDIIEHIENDGAFIEASLKYLKSNGIAIINVPAHQGLYSKYDKVMGHVKRYSKNDLEQLLTELGLQIEYSVYWGFFLLPTLFLRKLVLKFVKRGTTKLGFHPPHPFINKAFLCLYKFENWLLPNPITGTSLFFVVKKIKS